MALAHGSSSRASSASSRAAKRTTVSAAEQSWTRMFDKLPRLPHYQQHGNQDQQPPPTPPTPDNSDDESPCIGGDYDFVVPQAWPNPIGRIDCNIFFASRPFPVTRRSGRSDDKCYCYKCCVADDGTARTSSCINVSTYTVCDDLNCLLGPSCGNRFEPKIELQLIETRVGLGVVCYQDIPRGSFIVEYVGEILYADDAADRTARHYQVELRTKATWGGNTDLVIDARACGNKSRFISHSCRPNCVLFDCRWANLARLGVFAKRDIPALQELTFCYRENGRTLFSCACGFPECVSNQ